MGSTKRVFLALAIVLLLPAGAFAQDEVTEPEVNVDDADFTDPIVPREEQGEQEISVEVGCQAPELPDTFTLVTLETQGAPDWVQMFFNPAVLQWQTEAGDCPAPEPPFTGTTTAHVTVGPEAPAFETASFTIAATVQKIGPDDEEMTYGPYEAAVNVTPGYHHDQTLNVEEPIQDVGANDTVRFEGELTHEGNAGAAYELGLAEAPPGFETSLEPTEAELEPGESVAFTVEASLADPAIEEDATLALDLTAEGQPTHPDASQGGSDTTTLEATFRAPSEDADEQGTPAPGLAALLATAAAVALLARRRG